LDNWVIDLHKQIDLKDKLIEALQLKLIEKEQQIENMVDATCATNDLIQMVDVTCDTNDLIQMVDVTCDTNDLMVDTEATKDMVDDSLTSHEMESYNELMKISFVEDESQEEARSDTKSSINESKLEFSFKVTKENCHECMEEHQVQNDLSKPIIRPWEEIYDNKHRTRTWI
jgi:hypothetical protein